VPWTNRIYIDAWIGHPWEDDELNNYVGLLITIDPDIELKLVDYTRIVREGEEIRVTVEIRSNVEKERGAIMWVTVEDNTTNKILARIDIPVEPEKTLELRFKAPENPPLYWLIRMPSTTHSIGVVVVGYDMYTENNYASIDVLVVSNQWIAVAIGIALFIAVIVAISAVIRAVRHAIEEIEDEHRSFVKRKRFVYRK
jgi:hypothetical protein